MQEGEKSRAPLADDLMQTAEEIGKFTGLAPYAVARLARKNQLPGVFRLGGKICGLKSEIRAGMAAKARGEAA